MTPLESARAVADAVLYEGYVLYPYRASSPKNQVRWQWGVLMPPDVVARDPSERTAHQVEVLVDGGRPALAVTVRFLQVQARHVERALGQGRFESVDRLEVGDASFVPWDEARECELEVDVVPGDWSFHIAGGTDVEELRDAGGALVGRLVRTRLPLSVGVVMDVSRPESPYSVAQVRVRVENRTEPAEPPGETRQHWLRHALVAAHQLIRVEHGRLLSLLEPPRWAAPLASMCANDGVFPVLGGRLGDDSVVLASPIILYDHPAIAPESRTAFFDALEVDELLSLRTMTLSDEEKREVRGTDPRAAALLHDVDSMPDDLWERLHGTVRYLDSMTRPSVEDTPLDVPWWDPGADASVDPESDTVTIGDVEVARGTRVILRPGVRRADAYDLFLAGRTATVAAVLHDVDDATHLAVTVDEDPGADLKTAHGRYLYFSPDEVEPIRATSEATP